MISRYDTWAEQQLDEYLERYAKGSDETERRTVTCDFCGDDFDYEEGKVIDLCSRSNIKIRGHRPEQLYICNYCYRNADNIELED